MRFSKGKSFISPSRLFRAEKALYFPNLHGRTLEKSRGPRDTTPLLQDKISVLSIFSGAWAENQAASFVEPGQNPQLHSIINRNVGRAQLVRINIEENSLKAFLIQLFMPNLRRTVTKQEWSRYFLVRKGLTTELRDSIGFLNSKVGYTYLLDSKCRIRWAGSGVADEDERQSLVRGVRRLLDNVQATI
jgi:ATPase complex subunit ATP10